MDNKEPLEEDEFVGFFIPITKDEMNIFERIDRKNNEDNKGCLTNNIHSNEISINEEFKDNLADYNENDYGFLINMNKAFEHPYKDRPFFGFEHHEGNFYWE